MENNKREILVCECHSLEHQFAIWYDDEMNQLYIEPHLGSKPLLQRLKYAIKYIFGYKTKFGSFDEIIINPDDAQKLTEYLNKLKK
jgi:hypothetical protein